MKYWIQTSSSSFANLDNVKSIDVVNSKIENELMYQIRLDFIDGSSSFIDEIFEKEGQAEYYIELLMESINKNAIVYVDPELAHSYNPPKIKLGIDDK